METTEQWVIVELMGHQQIAGRYQEAAGGMHRIDVPDDASPNGFRFTRLYSPSAIYSITFVDEMSARHAAKMLSPRPVSIYGFETEMKRLIAPAKSGDTLECDNSKYEYELTDEEDFLTDEEDFLDGEN